MKHLAEKVIKLARVGCLLMALAGIFVSSLSFALGTIAWTGIDNTAVVSYEVAGTLGFQPKQQPVTFRWH